MMQNAALSALFTGLGILTKGPVAFLIFILTFGVWLICRRFRFEFRWKDVAVYAVVLCVVGGPASSDANHPVDEVMMGFSEFFNACRMRTVFCGKPFAFAVTM